MATTFPENEVEILRRYLPDELHAALQKARIELARIVEVTNVLSPETFEFLDGPLDPAQVEEQARSFAVNEARKTFLAFLDHAHLGGQDKPPTMVAFDAITDDLMRHELPGAIERLNTFDTDMPPIDDVQLDRQTLELAQTAQPIGYLITRVTKIIQTPQGPREIRVRNPAILEGYRASERLSPETIELLFTLVSFLTRTGERVFRLGIMRGEAHFGLRAFDEAIAQFSALLGTAHGDTRFPVVGTVIHELFELSRSDTSASGTLSTRVLEHLRDVLGPFPTVATAEETTSQPLTDAQKFAALRLAFAYLGLGDSLFRRRRSLDSSDRDAVRAAYDAAVRVVTSTMIAPENPLRRQVEQYAAQQIAKLDGGLNVLGYRDSYVPILRPEALQVLAERRIQAAADAVQRFEMFKARADQLQDQIADLNFQQDIKEKELAIADEQIAKAHAQVDIAEKQAEQIQKQLDALDTDTLTSVGGALLQAGAAAALAGSTGPAGSAITGTSVPGVVGALAGAASTLVGYSARKDDLKLQQEIARIGTGIARRDVSIAELGREIAETTVEFLGERVRRIQNRELNPDLYYAAGEAFRSLAERHLDAAMLWSFLFERSVAFLRLEPELQTIRLDYIAGQGGLLTAPERLRADLNDVTDLNLPITKFQFLTEVYSLRSFYPLEFNRFLQTGRMDFAMSLYELNKRRPGVHRQRIKRVQVELQSPPASGFTGRIRHRGSFLLRDRDTTPTPADGAFLPTGEQLAQALAAMGPGATQGVPIGGVIPFLLDVDTLELSPDEPPPDLGDPSPEALMPIEGYGPAGDWTLEVENVDLRFITDALLKITYVIPESDEPLSIRVKELIAAYERELLQGDALDLITPFSLRQRFPDAFSQLASSQAQFAIARNDFPAGITGLRLKAIVAQALDANKRGIEGVALEFTKIGGPVLIQRSTRADGFSEDVTAPIPGLPPDQRIALEGTYAVRLVDPVQAAALNDLLVFFVYEFQEV